MDKEYKPKKIEEDIQAYWDKSNSFKTDFTNKKNKFYCLSMFPYPSGKLHIGHVRNYTIGDVISRLNKMIGKNIFQPMGWDAFGLPAENAAIANKTHPSKWTKKNIDYMRLQLKRLGFAYDWDNEISTADPKYYRWEQWFFLKLMKKNLVYRKKSEVNWDPVDKTVLANEQVIDGKGWRSGAAVQRKEIPQWFLKITAYSDELLNSIDNLDAWPSSVKLMQKNWIGKSEGASIIFKILDSDKSLKVYTTRIDTIYGVTFLAMSPNHSLIKSALDSNSEIKSFVNQCSNLKVSEETIGNIDKKGIDTGIKAINPINGRIIPVWIANYILSDYGTGCVMSVPGHDERDNEFALKYNLPVIDVIKSKKDLKNKSKVFTDDGILIKSDKYTGLDSAIARKSILEELEKKHLAESKINYRLRDWGISRQRYWGCPIPIIYHDDGTIYPVPEEDLPVTLPDDIDLSEDGNPLENHPTWKYIKCPYTGKDAIRETDTFDTFFESSWYYLRFLSPEYSDGLIEKSKKDWLPVDQYIGGIEHAILHLLYARLFHKLLRDEGVVDGDEPFQSLLSQGMVLQDGVKMSKSKGNTIDPDDIIKKYGADTIRLFIMFSAPPEQSLEWSDSAIEGSYKFLKRLWNLSYEVNKNKSKENIVHNEKSKTIRTKIHKTITKVTNDYFKRKSFNTAIASMMELFNELIRYSQDKNHHNQILLEGLENILKMLSPIAPHITQKIWKDLGNKSNVMDESWPVADKNALVESKKEIIVQINGKLRGKVIINMNQDENEIKKLVMKNDKISSYLRDVNVKKIIYIKDKLINYVI